MDALDRRQLPRDLAGGVVIALHNADPDSRAREPQHLLAEEEAGAEVDPVAVIDVAGKQDQVHRPFEGQVHQGDERLSRGAAQPLDGRALVAVQPLERAVDVQVGCVDEFQAETSGDGAGLRCARAP